MKSLDSLNIVEEIDAGGMLRHCERMGDYCENMLQAVRNVTIPDETKLSNGRVISYGKPLNIVVAGMGGSAFSGELVRDWLRFECSTPIEVCKDYLLPAHVDEDTLVFVVSYSGDTEEAISTFIDALKKRSMLITISSNGLLLSSSRKMGVPHVVVPRGLPPRSSFPFILVSLIVLLEKLGVIRDSQKEINEAIRILRLGKEKNGFKCLTKHNPAKKLAFNIKGKIPVVYGFRQYSSVAFRWKTQFNENSKCPSFYNVFPELTHNEVAGWKASSGITEKFCAILLRERNEPAEIRARIKETKKFALKNLSKTFEVYAHGKSSLAKMLHLLHLGDFVSIYLAILLDIDPTPVEMISKIKKNVLTRRKLENKLKELVV